MKIRRGGTVFGLLIVFLGGQIAQGQVIKKGFEVDVRSHGRAIADETRTNGVITVADAVSPVPGATVVPQVQWRGGNLRQMTQVSTTSRCLRISVRTLSSLKVKPLSRPLARTS